MDKAQCQNANPAIFDGHCTRRETPLDALAYCRLCPVLARCLQYAFDHNDIQGEQGIWGGTTAYQRRQIRRGRSRRACPACSSPQIERVAPAEVCLGCGMSWRVPIPAGMLAVAA